MDDCGEGGVGSSTSLPRVCAPGPGQRHVGKWGVAVRPSQGLLHYRSTDHRHEDRLQPDVGRTVPILRGTYAPRCDPFFPFAFFKLRKKSSDQYTYAY